MNDTELICVIDKSGSMWPHQVQAITSFNEFLAGQKEVAGKASLTLVLFDSTVTNLYDGVDIQEVEGLTTKTYSPHSATALWDAVGSAIDNAGDSFAARPETDRPQKVMFIILTDGLENASRYYTEQQVKDKIKHQTERYSWEFVYLGIGIDANREAGKLGVVHAMSVDMVQQAYQTMGHLVASYRSSGSVEIRN